MARDTVLYMTLVLLVVSISSVAYRNWKWKRREQMNAYLKMKHGRTLPITADLGKHRKRKFKIF